MLIFRGEPFRADNRYHDIGRFKLLLDALWPFDTQSVSDVHVSVDFDALFATEDLACTSRTLDRVFNEQR